MVLLVLEIMFLSSGMKSVWSSTFGVRNNLFFSLAVQSVLKGRNNIILLLGMKSFFFFKWDDDFDIRNSNFVIRDEKCFHKGWYF